MRFRFQSGQKVYQVSIEKHGDGFRATVDGQPYEIEVLDSQPGELSLRFEGMPLTLYWAEDGGKKWIALDGCTHLIEKPSSPSARRSGEGSGENVVRAPMPAQVRSVEVSEGDTVSKGQTLLLLEAMKMEIRLKAPRNGRVASLRVKTGQSVERDQVLIEMEDMKGEA